MQMAEEAEHGRHLEKKIRILESPRMKYSLSQVSAILDFVRATDGFSRIIRTLHSLLRTCTVSFALGYIKMQRRHVENDLGQGGSFLVRSRSNPSCRSWSGMKVKQEGR